MGGGGVGGTGTIVQLEPKPGQFRMGWKNQISSEINLELGKEPCTETASSLEPGS